MRILLGKLILQPPVMSLSKGITTHPIIVDFGQVRMGNKGVCKIYATKDMWIETNIGCKLLFKNVIHVPNI